MRNDEAGDTSANHSMRASLPPGRALHTLGALAAPQPRIASMLPLSELSQSMPTTTQHMPPSMPPPSIASRGRANSNVESLFRVRLPDADRPVSVRVKRGATVSELVAPALAKRLPVSALSASAYSFVCLPDEEQPGFIVNSDVPLDALRDMIGGDDDDDADDDESTSKASKVLEMWERPDVMVRFFVCGKTCLGCGCLVEIWRPFRECACCNETDWECLNENVAKTAFLLAN